MIKFNNNEIITGYIKQLLSSFNLPQCPVYTENTMAVSGINYIYNDMVQEYKVDENNNVSWSPKFNYYYNVRKENFTKNFITQNNFYDSYTHEYLGDYLRFLRDYNHLDLMPLYNCFSNNICTNLDYTYKSNEYTARFNSKDTSYKIYILPVKLNKEYTIAIDCSSKIELICGFYDKYLNIKNTSTFMNKTYKTITSSYFNKPFLYDKLLANNLDIDEPNISKKWLVEHEEDLKLFIKVPTNTKSSITILEGNYISWNDSISKFKEDKLIKIKNTAIINFENNITSTKYFKPIGTLQLLLGNTKESYPFADKLIEYLVGNVITNEDHIADDIKRAIYVIQKNNKKIKLNEYGAWDEQIRPLVYNYFTNDTLIDNLGYIDKDVEKNYAYKYLDGNNKQKSITISGVDIYEEEN